jgi:hypothetical protein
MTPGAGLLQNLAKRVRDAQRLLFRVRQIEKFG